MKLCSLFLFALCSFSIQLHALTDKGKEAAKQLEDAMRQEAALDKPKTGEGNRSGQNIKVSMMPRLRELLANSSEALSLHTQLLKNREHLRQLPITPCPPDLSAAIFAALAKLPAPVPTTPLMPVRPSPRRAWLPISIAAMVFATISTVAYLQTTPNSNTITAARQLQELPEFGTTFAPPPGRVTSPLSSVMLESTIDQEPTSLPVEEVAVAPEDPQPRPVATPTTPGDHLLAAPVGERPRPFEAVRLQLPLLIPVSEFVRNDTQTALQNQFRGDQLVRIDLFVKDAVSATEALAHLSKTASVDLLTDTIAQERLNRKMPSCWVIFSEFLTPKEVSTLFASCAEFDEQAVQGNRPAVFGTMHAVRATTTDLKELRDLMAIDLAAKPKPGTETTKRISDGTIDELTNALQNTPGVKIEKPAVMVTALPYLARVHPLLSKDLKQYQELRKNRTPGSAPVMIVIRQAANG